MLTRFTMLQKVQKLQIQQISPLHLLSLKAILKLKHKQRTKSILT